MTGGNSNKKQKQFTSKSIRKRERRERETEERANKEIISNTTLYAAYHHTVHLDLHCTHTCTHTHTLSCSLRLLLYTDLHCKSIKILFFLSSSSIIKSYLFDALSLHLFLSLSTQHIGKNILNFQHKQASSAVSTNIYSHVQEGLGSYSN